ncbi:unnamed protein product, partial [Didymodactylos carnosus]
MTDTRSPTPHTLVSEPLVTEAPISGTSPAICSESSHVHHSPQDPLQIILQRMAEQTQVMNEKFEQISKLQEEQAGRMDEQSLRQEEIIRTIKEIEGKITPPQSAANSRPHSRGTFANGEIMVDRRDSSPSQQNLQQFYRTSQDQSPNHSARHYKEPPDYIPYNKVQRYPLHEPSSKNVAFRQSSPTYSHYSFDSRPPNQRIIDMYEQEFQRMQQLVVKQSRTIEELSQSAFSSSLLPHNSLTQLVTPQQSTMTGNDSGASTVSVPVYHSPPTSESTGTFHPIVRAPVANPLVPAVYVTPTPKITTFPFTMSLNNNLPTFRGKAEEMPSKFITDFELR